MTHRYEVKIDDSVLPELYTFDQLIEKGILDDVDEHIKVRQYGETNWVTARKYPFADMERNVQQNNSSQNKEAVRKTPPQIRINQHPVPHEPINSNITHRWNWGAFSFSWFWGVLNGLYWPLIIIACNFIPYVGVICSICLSIFLGLKGNEFAWRIAKRNGTTLYSFTKLQARWNVAGICFFVFVVFFAICYIVFKLI